MQIITIFLLMSVALPSAESKDMKFSDNLRTKGYDISEDGVAQAFRDAADNKDETLLKECLSLIQRGWRSENPAPVIQGIKYALNKLKPKEGTSAIQVLLIIAICDFDSSHTLENERQYKPMLEDFLLHGDIDYNLSLMSIKGNTVSVIPCRVPDASMYLPLGQFDIDCSRAIIGFLLRGRPLGNAYDAVTHELYMAYYNKIEKDTLAALLKIYEDRYPIFEHIAERMKWDIEELRKMDVNIAEIKARYTAK